MHIQGVVSIVSCDTGSKSEGRAAYLLIDGGNRYRLYRANVMDVDDICFAPFVNQQVVVEGDVENDDYLCVSEIRLLMTSESDNQSDDVCNDNNATQEICECKDEEDLHEMQ